MFGPKTVKTERKRYTLKRTKNGDTKKTKRTKKVRQRKCYANRAGNGDENRKETLPGVEAVMKTVMETVWKQCGNGVGGNNCGKGTKTVCQQIETKRKRRMETETKSGAMETEKIALSGSMVH